MRGCSAITGPITAGVTLRPTAVSTPHMPVPKRLEQILDLARWAPSGDNTQPWRFEVLDEENVVVRGFDTREHCVYDLDGRPSQISLGALLETMAIAATGHGLRTEVHRRADAAEACPTFDVRFADEAASADPLIDAITARCVQRKPMGMRALNDAQMQALQDSVGPDHRVVWIEGMGAKLRISLLLFGYAKLRLTMPEAYNVHRDVIEWRARYSADRIPDRALGIDPMTAALMRFVMRSWARVRFFNRFLAGTWMPRIQMDFVPGLGCAAHFMILARREPVTTDDYVAAGRAVQRFWLTLTQQGLYMQPSLTPLIFSRYERQATRFSSDAASRRLNTELASRLADLVGSETTRLAMFMGRVGAGAAPTSRSLRRELNDLLV